MYFCFLKFLISSILFSQVTWEETKPNNQRPEELLLQVNSGLERLEIDLRGNVYKKACLEAAKTAELIKNNYNELKAIEPYYNWLEIKKTLNGISKKYSLNAKK